MALREANGGSVSASVDGKTGSNWRSSGLDRPCPRPPLLFSRSARNRRFSIRNPRVQFCFLFWILTTGLSAQKFFPDDPIRVDEDDLDIDQPAFLDVSPTLDALENTLEDQGYRPVVRATNVNTLGEVPDSSWFTNRMADRGLSVTEMVRGGDVKGGPDFSESVEILGARMGALTESLVIRDRRGDIYFVKFDPDEFPRLGTGADVITTKFLWSAGYNVLPTCIVRLDPTRLVLAADARITMLGGREAPLDRSYVDDLLQRAYQEDGRYPVSASRLIEGKIVGRFRFHGVRRGDPNDIFLHENRRELRALRVFASWLNYDQANPANTLDFYVTERGRSFLKHFLLDFTSSLGSGYDLNNRITPKDPSAGYEHVLIGDGTATLKSVLSLGLWQRPWSRVDYPFPRLREIGRIEADFYRPEIWKPAYPTPAFGRMLADDAFWAVKILSRFSDQTIRSIVASAEYADPEAERYLADTLIERRKKILRYYLSLLNPLAGFQLADGGLLFRNLGQEAGLVENLSYGYQWFHFDNIRDESSPLGATRFTGLNRIQVPQTDSRFRMVRIRTRADEMPGWMRDVRVYLRDAEIVGIERECEEEPVH